MNPRITLLVVAVFALLLGYVYFVEVNKTPEQLGTPVPTPQPQLFSLSAGNVKSLQIRDLRSPREVTVTRTDSGWQLETPDNKPADATKVDSAVSQLISLQASRVISNVADLAPFGFNAATLEARLVMSDTTAYAITVGEKTTDSSSYYVIYTGDRSKVYLISAYAIESLVEWLNTPPYQPTPTATPTATPLATPTVEGTATPGAEATVPPPNIVPTLGVPPAATPTP